MQEKNQHELMRAYKQAGGLPEVFHGKKFAYLMVHGNKVFKSHTIDGLELRYTETEKGVDISFRMKEGYSFDNPVNICFGIIPEEGTQEINVKGVIEDNAKLEFLAYCVFPKSLKIKHIMIGDVKIGDNSSFRYNEVHYHGPNGGITVTPRLKVFLGKNSSYESNFYLLKGRAGKIRMDYDVTVGENSRADILAKVMASGSDDVYIKEKVILKGQNSKGTIKTRTIGRDDSKIDIVSELVAEQAGCMGHVDCIETVLDGASAKATPVVDVKHKDARVTHEAAVGSLNSKQLEVLMARGLSKEEAQDVLVESMLK